MGNAHRKLVTGKAPPRAAKRLLDAKVRKGCVCKGAGDGIAKLQGAKVKTRCRDIGWQRRRRSNGPIGAGQAGAVTGERADAAASHGLRQRKRNAGGQRDRSRCKRPRPGARGDARCQGRSGRRRCDVEPELISRVDACAVDHLCQPHRGEADGKHRALKTAANQRCLHRRRAGRSHNIAADRPRHAGFCERLRADAGYRRIGRPGDRVHLVEQRPVAAVRVERQRFSVIGRFRICPDEHISGDRRRTGWRRNEDVGNCDLRRSRSRLIEDRAVRDAQKGRVPDSGTTPRGRCNGSDRGTGCSNRKGQNGAVGQSVAEVLAGAGPRSCIVVGREV